MSTHLAARSRAMSQSARQRRVLSAGAALAIVVVFSCAMAFLPPRTNAQGVRSALREARANGIVRIGVDYAPVPLQASDYEVRRDEGFEAIIQDDLSQIWGVTVELVQIPPRDRLKALRERRVDALLARVKSSDALFSDTETSTTGYASALAPIMRSDTDIKSWDQLANRNVCVSASNSGARALVKTLHGVVVMTKAPAKSLAAMRSGECDAAIHDNDMLGRLLKLGNGRWEKYSATLPAQDQETLVFATLKGDYDSARLLESVTKRWKSEDQWTSWTDRRAADVDFETYLEQDAPDCH